MGGRGAGRNAKGMEGFCVVWCSVVVKGRVFLSGVDLRICGLGLGLDGLSDG